MKKVALALFATCATIASLSASTDRPIPIPDRAKGAETIVVATVIEVSAGFERNEFGDRLIVSHTFLQVEETLKGSALQVVAFDVEGGTVGDLTLRVSDMETLAKGDRAVFFMTRSRAGANVPHLRHNGIMKLDRANHVRGSDLTLDDVKRQVKQGGK
jgi:hypothetical protein